MTGTHRLVSTKSAADMIHWPKPGPPAVREAVPEMEGAWHQVWSFPRLGRQIKDVSSSLRIMTTLMFGCLVPLFPRVKSCRLQIFVQHLQIVPAVKTWSSERYQRALLFYPVESAEADAKVGDSLSGCEKRSPGFFHSIAPYLLQLFTAQWAVGSALTPRTWFESG